MKGEKMGEKKETENPEKKEVKEKTAEQKKGRRLIWQTEIKIALISAGLSLFSIVYLYLVAYNNQITEINSVIFGSIIGAIIGSIFGAIFGGIIGGIIAWIFEKIFINILNKLYK